MSEVEHLLATQCVAGESPIWIPEEAALYFVDCEGDLAYRYTPADGELQTFTKPGPITAIARRASGGWITATKQGLAFWDHASGAYEPLADPEADQANCRLNDGVVDPKGRYLVDSLNQQDLNAPDGRLHRYDADGTLTALAGGYAVANGLALRPDGGELYLTDMFHGRILAYDYDLAAGTVSGERVLVEVPPEAGVPDGLIVDSEGFLWSAHWGGWRVTRYTPAGQIDREIRLPVANVTCMAFGGSDLRDLYITTAHFFLSEEERAAQPLAGDLFRVATDVRGLVESAFAG